MDTKSIQKLLPGRQISINRRLTNHSRGHLSRHDEDPLFSYVMQRL